ncbi:ABC transporter ATP-binding protein, partial [Providencia rettgeri]|nr:ABC transporter ATP-binding protein [Providencia rettgeri]
FLAALETINMPDAWRAVGELVKQGLWVGNIPHNESQLVQAFKERYAATR